MAASAGVMKFVGKSGRAYSVDIYIPDAVATYLTFNPSGLAATTSPAFWIAPEDCVLVDVSTAAAPTAVGFTVNVNGAAVNGGAIRWADYLNTLPSRPALNIGVARGSQVSGKQY